MGSRTGKSDHEGVVTAATGVTGEMQAQVSEEPRDNAQQNQDGGTVAVSDADAVVAATVVKTDKMKGTDRRLPPPPQTTQSAQARQYDSVPSVSAGPPPVPAGGPPPAVPPRTPNMNLTKAGPPPVPAGGPPPVVPQRERDAEGNVVPFALQAGEEQQFAAPPPIPEGVAPYQSSRSARATVYGPLKQRESIAINAGLDEDEPVADETASLLARDPTITLNEVALTLINLLPQPLAKESKSLLKVMPLRKAILAMRKEFAKLHANNKYNAEMNHIAEATQALIVGFLVNNSCLVEPGRERCLSMESIAAREACLAEYAKVVDKYSEKSTLHKVLRGVLIAAAFIVAPLLGAAMGGLLGAWSGPGAAATATAGALAGIKAVALLFAGQTTLWASASSGLLAAKIISTVAGFIAVPALTYASYKGASNYFSPLAGPARSVYQAAEKEIVANKMDFNQTAATQAEQFDISKKRFSVQPPSFSFSNGKAKQSVPVTGDSDGKIKPPAPPLGMHGGVEYV